MKERKGFVSNSSSSSFICDVSGSEYSGWDACLSEAEMVECTNGHTFCDSYVVGGFDNAFDDMENWTGLIVDNFKYEAWYVGSKKDVDYDEKVKAANKLSVDGLKDLFGKKEVEEFIENFKEDPYDYDTRYEFSTKLCPICQLVEIADRDMVKYLVKLSGKTEDAIKEEMKGKFDSIDDLDEFIK